MTRTSTGCAFCLMVGLTACAEPEPVPMGAADRVAEAERLLATDAQRAIAEIQRAVALEPSEPRWRDALIRAALEAGEYELALNTLSALDEDEQRAEHRAWRVQACAGDAPCLRAALLAQDEARDQPKRALADALAALNANDDALRLYQEAFHDGGDDSAVGPLLSLLLLRAEERVSSDGDVQTDGPRWREVHELRNQIEALHTHARIGEALRTRAEAWLAANREAPRPDAARRRPGSAGAERSLLGLGVRNGASIELGLPNLQPSVFGGGLSPSSADQMDLERGATEPGLGARGGARDPLLGGGSGTGFSGTDRPPAGAAR